MKFYTQVWKKFASSWVQEIRNPTHRKQAIISGGGEIYTRTAEIQVGYRVFLPVISRTW